MKYLNRLPDVLPAVNVSLQNLGDGNWKMGQGVGKGGNIKAKGTGAVDESELLENYISKSSHHLSIIRTFSDTLMN